MYSNKQAEYHIDKTWYSSRKRKIDYKLCPKRFFIEVFFRKGILNHCIVLFWIHFLIYVVLSLCFGCILFGFLDVYVLECNIESCSENTRFNTQVLSFDDDVNLFIKVSVVQGKLELNQTWAKYQQTNT